MIKFRGYYDKDDEERFLNSMSANGYAMKKFFLGLYWFDRCSPNEYTYRVDIINDKYKPEKKEFYDLVSDTGAELIQTWRGWAFFRKKSSNFELYTDNESRIDQYKRIRKTWMSLGICEALVIPNILNCYFLFDIKAYAYIVFLLAFAGFIFFYQVYKCSKKISKLKNKL